MCMARPQEALAEISGMLDVFYHYIPRNVPRALIVVRNCDKCVFLTRISLRPLLGFRKLVT